VFTCFVESASARFPLQLLRLFVPFLLLSSLLLTGCRNPIDPSVFDSLAKTNVDMIADSNLRELNRLMEELLVKLYKRNPLQLDNVPGMSIGQREVQIFDNPGRLIFGEFGHRQGTNALNLAFDPLYQGDRVFALMTGMVGMVRSSYNWQEEQFMLDSLDEQLLFNSARNIEVLAWRLSNSRDATGKLLLLSNSQPGEKENLSYERIFGKMIAIQDMMAFAVVGKWERGFNSVLQKAVFFPMGL
jgi:hypothetical protein